METIRDMLYVKSVEKRLGRTLNEEELSGESHRAFLPTGEVEFIEVPLLEFPYDLLTKPEDYYQSETSNISNVA